MQDTLHFFLPNSKPSFPPPHHDYFPSLPCPRTRTLLHFPALSSKTTTNTTTAISPPPKPLSRTPQIQPAPSSPTQQKQQLVQEEEDSNDKDKDNNSNEFQEKLFYLDSIGLDVFSLVDHHHHHRILLSTSLADIKSIVDLLTSMNFTTPELCRIFSMCPEILASNATSILPIFTFLLREARVEGAHLKRVINRRPRLLASSVKHCLRPTLYFLHSIGIAQVNYHTYLLSCSVENKLLLRIQYFERIGFSYKESVSMFRRFPQLFNYSIKENLEPKLNYLVVEMGRDLKELINFPHYFSFSLENRIKPRHQSCVENGVFFPLRAMLKPSEAQFRSRLEVCFNSSAPLPTSPLFSVNWRDTLDSDIK
ncbi:hypothetical protein Tsubulata_004597 [Turnera subulata]|uniref:Uncharacterized protein n=1 Tax=Turnera subulata TaxID=218843 RepID=A0A9Q0GHZ7_9ROSI|nr:hypothetical protein Tsubulata_004597 [Turnera subulata]